jgi:hypothetical protein
LFTVTSFGGVVGSLIGQRRVIALLAALVAGLALAVVATRITQADERAGEFSLEARIAPEQVAVGDTFTVELAIEHDGSTAYQAAQWSVQYNEGTVEVSSVAASPDAPAACHLSNDNGDRILTGCIVLGGPLLTYFGIAWDITARCIAEGWADFSVESGATGPVSFVSVGTGHLPSHLHSDSVWCGSSEPGPTNTPTPTFVVPPTPTPTRTPNLAVLNDDFDFSRLIQSLPYADVQDTTEATLEDGELRPCGGSMTNTVWYRYLPSRSRQLVIDTAGSNFDTIIAVYGVGGVSPPGGIGLVACNDDGFGLGSQSRLEVQLAAGVLYYIQAGGVGSGGELHLNVSSTSTLGGAIAGRVTDETGAPIGGATVRGEPYDCCGASTETTTSADGTYALGDLDPGRYVVFADADGHVGEFYVDARDYFEATPVYVAASVVEGIDFSLQRSAAITGTVRRGDGAPLSFASVYATSVECCDFAFTTANANGVYRLDKLRGGAYFVRAEVFGYAYEWYDDAYRLEDAQPVTVAPGDEASNVDFSLATAAVISGRVVDRSGAPIFGARIWAVDECCPTATDASDFSGSFQLGPLQPGPHRIQALAPGYATEWYDDAYDPADALTFDLQPAQEVTGIEIDLLRGGTVTGRVTDELGNGIAGAVVEAFIPSCCDTIASYALTDADGSYSITGVPPSPHYVHVTADGYLGEYYDNALDFEYGIAVAVTDEQTISNIDFTLGRASYISGTVTDTNGSPLPGGWVRVESSDGSLCCTFDYVDEQGRYRSAPLRPGTYLAEAASAGMAPEYYDNVFERDDATSIVVGAATEVTGIDFRLAPPTPDNVARASRIDALPYFDVRDTSGATLEEGEPQPCGDIGATVWYAWTVTASPPISEPVTFATNGSDYDTVLAVYRATNGFSPPDGANLELVGCNDDAAAGAPELLGLPGGASSVSFTAEAGSTYYIQAGGKSGATGLLVLNGFCDSDPACSSGGAVSGRVTGTRGEPIAGAFVSADRDVCCAYGYAYSGADGRYTINNLPPGAYRVFASRDPYIGEYYDGATIPGDATLVLAVARFLTRGIDFELSRPDPDNIAFAVEIDGVPYGDERDTTGATLEEGEPQPCGNIGSTAWYRFAPAFSPPLSGTVSVHTVLSDFDTVLAVYAVDALVPSPPGGTLELIACNDDLVADATCTPAETCVPLGIPPESHNRSLVEFTVNPGTIYYIQAGGRDGAQGTLRLDVSASGGAPPTPTPTIIGAITATPSPTSTPPAATVTTTPTTTSTAPGGIGGPEQGTGTPTRTPPSFSATPTPIATGTAVATATHTPTTSSTPLPTATHTPTATADIPTETATAQPTASPTPTPVPPTPTATHPSTSTPTATPTATATASGTATPTASVTATATITATPGTVTPSSTTTTTPAVGQATVTATVTGTAIGTAQTTGVLTTPTRISTVLGTSRTPDGRAVRALPRTGDGGSGTRNAVIAGVLAGAALAGAGAGALTMRRQRD